MTQKLRLIGAALVVAFLTAACGSSSSTQRPASTTSTVATVAAAPAASAGKAQAKAVSGHTTIAIRNYMFLPMHLTVTAGTKVSFHNDDQTAHTATAINQSFDSGTIQPGRTATVRFQKTGTYAYHCLFHAFMTATITVVPAKS